MISKFIFFAILFFTFVPNDAFPILPSPDGQFPDGFWNEISYDTIVNQYGDPGFQENGNGLIKACDMHCGEVLYDPPNMEQAVKARVSLFIL